MDALIARISKDFADMKEEIKTDEVVDQWPLLNPLIVASIIIGYLVFTLKIGPEMMKDREPMSLKLPMIIYNAFQVIYNLWMFVAMFSTPGAITYLIENVCVVNSDKPADNWGHPLYYAMCSFGWYYLVSKVLDLFDTIFFVLRKKQSHVTFLHVYHHASLVFVGWAFVKFIRGRQGVLIGFINAFVHTVMYFYYFLSALGDAVKPFLSWKPYITKIQLLQFAFIIAYLSSLLVFDCQLPKVYSYYMLANGILFFYLFLDFYQKTYGGKKETAPKRKRKTSDAQKPQKQVAIPGSDFFKVITHGMSFMCFPGLQDELYNDDDES
ncbi:elongation of very long chain fatty acids protein 7 [Nilaparvata lugens]|uniref:Elongation of very long chain fatty acids protein n=1 Tax=Nilaparvata lugens TaxID=108931 RepID=A0A3Q8FS02_NILLU|nr:elongation of very long chain fatty acids protein 7 [Nilaparvata lugens]XP_039295539.1 elongation of very long chain fatty acids protein 7 [Nilaparvata lugens]AWJ25045.1 fatty acid elongase [Nilaparvata lugens]